MKRIFIIFFFALISILTASAKNIYMVSVGICDYKFINGLRNTENDARNMAELYRTHTQNVTLLLGAAATHDAILRTITKAFSQAGEDDTVVLFFSGHGGKGGLCAYDTKSEQTMVTYAELQQAIHRCKARNKQLFIDACYSGGLRKSGEKTSKESTMLAKTEGIMLFLSSRTGEKSIENPWASNGFFTQYLIRGIKGAADTDGDRIVTAKEIFKFVSSNVSQRTKKRQNPVMWGRFDDNMHIMNWNPKKN